MTVCTGWKTLSVVAGADCHRAFNEAFGGGIGDIPSVTKEEAGGVLNT